MKLLQIPGNVGALYHWLSTFDLTEFVSEGELNCLGEGSILALPGGNVGGMNFNIAKQVSGAFSRGCRLFAICGSFQSLFGGTEEDTHLSCLRVFPGRTKKLDYPRIGCFDIQCDWFCGSPYYNHSYAVSIGDGQYQSDPNTDFMLDTTGYCQAVRSKKILGVQFHPELSSGIFDEAFFQWLGEK